jgi:hypothetical protein
LRRDVVDLGKRVFDAGDKTAGERAVIDAAVSVGGAFGAAGGGCD